MDQNEPTDDAPASDKQATDSQAADKYPTTPPMAGSTDTIPVPEADGDNSRVGDSHGSGCEADAVPAADDGAGRDVSDAGPTDTPSRPDSLERSAAAPPEADGGERRTTRSSTRHMAASGTIGSADDGVSAAQVRESARLAAAGETASGASYVHPDGGTMSSQRHRLIPPDGKPLRWWHTHREKLELAETILSGLFILLALYFLYLWFFAAGEIAYDPSREGFVQALAALPAVRPESEWRVRATPGRWRNIVVHHTATKTGSAESIDRYHREVNKWENGLGYHFIIGNGHGMADGEVAMSRRWREQLDGAHVRMKGNGKANSWSIGIALVGNFEEEVATPRQLAALKGLLAFLLQEYGIKNEEIVGHGQVSVNYTACPGKLFFLDEVLKTL